MLDTFFKHAADIIREARQSPLGIAALIVLAAAVAVVLLFREEADPMVRVIAVALLLFVLLCIGLLMSGRGLAPSAAIPPASPSSVGGRSGHRLLGLVAIGGLGVLIGAVWWAADRFNYRQVMARMETADPIGGWTTLPESWVLEQFGGGQLSLYPRDALGTLHTYVLIPRSQVRAWDWTKDGEGNDMMVVTVKGP